jgi:hypothetical protein
LTSAFVVVLANLFLSKNLNILQVGQHLAAVVIGVNKRNYSVDLSIKPSLLREGEDYWISQRHRDQSAQRWFSLVGKDPNKLFDTCFLEGEALRKYREAERGTSESGHHDSQSKSIGNNGDNYRYGSATASSSASSAASVAGGSSSLPMSRSIQHPLFKNCDYKEAEEYLRTNGVAGDMIVRPSSKGTNKLAITWAFQYDFFKHIDVEERGRRPGAVGLGSELIILEPDMENELFTDLDHIYQSYITPMNDFVSSMLQHRCFRSGSVEAVEDFLRQQRDENPKQIPYCVRLEPNKAGCFALTWMSLNVTSTQPFKKELVYVRPNVRHVDVIDVGKYLFWCLFCCNRDTN